MSSFVNNACSGVGSSLDRPIPLTYEAIHIGRKTTHHSHTLYTFKNMIYCNKCGMRCHTKLQNLSSPCLPPTVYGLETFKAIAEGRLPKGPYFPTRKSCQSKTSKPVKAPVYKHEEASDKQKFDNLFGLPPQEEESGYSSLPSSSPPLKLPLVSKIL